MATDYDTWGDFLHGWTVPPDTSAHACNCVGPQRGDPVCPCQMRNVQVRDGRYVTIIDHGPAASKGPSPSLQPAGK
jgi:hypothetical protein